MTQSNLKIVLLGDAAHVNVQRWCQGLSGAGAEVHVLSFAGHVPQPAVTHRLPATWVLSKLRYFVSAPYVRRLTRSIRPDVMIAYYVTGYGTLAAWSGFHPLVQVTSGSDILIAPQHPLMRRIVKFNLSRADLVTAWAPHMADAARALGISDERLMVLPRGIPVQDFAGHHCSLPTDDGAVRLICTRTLKRGYNIDVLIRAVQVLKERGASFSLTLAGDGPLREDLMALARQLGVEQHILFAGFVSNEQLPALLAQHDVYISPVKSDGVSASLLEAMAVGLLPIVPDNPANRFWITPGDNGMLLRDLAVDTVAAAIQRGAEDVQMRGQARQSNPATVTGRADLYRNAAQYLDRFRKIVNESTRPDAVRA